ncbi:hypothetical protein TNCV_3321651 [Trichonephila clavipes]|nr:hypothetical protein TNCV_3321651 [Trichonephila clavipes]
MSGKKETQKELEKALDLLLNLPSVKSEALTDDSSEEEVPENNLLKFSLDSNWRIFPFSSLAEIVEVEREVVSPSIVPSGRFTELKSHCHLYGAQGQRQAYLLPMPR